MAENDAIRDDYEDKYLGGGEDDVTERLADIDDETAEARAQALLEGLEDYDLDEEDRALLGAWGFELDEEEEQLADPVVAIVGRPNVGKSTIINRILGRREAVVEDKPGVTRDRVSYKAEWLDKRFTLVDTGGWESDARGIDAQVADQAEIAVEQADVVILVVDARVGITASDEQIVRMLRRVKKPIILMANKIDDAHLEPEIYNLWSLGMGQPFPVSGLHGRGLADALDELLEVMPEHSQYAQPDALGGPRRVALIGRPNVGKSSLLNKLAGSERAVVNDLAGTTRDPIDEVIELDRKRRELLQMTEALKSERNAETKKIALAKKNKEDASAAISAMREVGTKIAAIDKELAGVELILQDRLLRIPNMTDASVPVGKDDSENPEVRRWGEIRKFPFPAKEHYELGENLGILDSERAGKVSGARFYFYLSMAARLERAVYNFMLDVHTQQNDFTEVIPPYIINGASMQGTGQLPKFEDDMYKVEGENMYMTPTAEVPLTNYFSGEILDGAVLPIHLTALTPCFRKEAGSAGKDTRGLIRQHQFHKVEMVKYCKPEDSWDELESLTAEAEKILQLLKLPYHVVCLCTGDIGFSSAKTYDIEVWMPGQQKYREISSCSNCLDFQARRANIRFRRHQGDKPEFVHTLNGSGLAVGRTVAAIMENYQQEDGTIVVPDVLRPYMNGLEIIGKRESFVSSKGE